ncbi:hypothetical protein EMGBS6_00350 [Opitutia bacterium]|nr:hypothetical protein EMGBS6_00350 [Opitutae bacterium]
MTRRETKGRAEVDILAPSGPQAHGPSFESSPRLRSRIFS